MIRRGEEGRPGMKPVGGGGTLRGWRLLAIWGTWRSHILSPRFRISLCLVFTWQQGSGMIAFGFVL